MGYKIKDETTHGWNPINVGKVRNFECPCGSGKKVKKCHGQIRIVDKDSEKYFKEVMKVPTAEYFQRCAKASKEYLQAKIKKEQEVKSED